VIPPIRFILTISIPIIEMKCNKCGKEFGEQSEQIDLICLGTYNECSSCLTNKCGELKETFDWFKKSS